MAYPLDQFLTRVDRSDKAGCWPWTGARTLLGYGQLGRYGSRYYAHRISYELFVGPIPRGKNVLHRCDNPPCVRPDHLFLGTQADNLADMAAKRRSGPRRTKLSDAVVTVIRASTESQAELARRYGVNQSTISRIVNRKRRIR